MHYHLHVIPRFEGDGLKHWPGNKLEEEEMKQIQEAVKNSLE
jgi:diadenosine tetraphosphate (Ap4A) HIT family hydrolase